MGVAFKDLIVSNEVDLDFFKGKTIILDGNNVLYQFLTTIRGRDGALLTDSKGNVTSHLLGLFTRTTSLMNKGLRLAFVFDGKAPELKQRTREKRKALKVEAERKFMEAKKKEDLGEMKKYASRTSRLTRGMIEESKKLISFLGLPVVQAPSEGEAQAAYMVKDGGGFGVGSQDYDSLVHGATKLVRNLSIAGKRKKGKSPAYITIKPEIMDLAENLNNLGIDQNQLIALAMLIGTDYNPGGIKGIGPKNALKFVRKHKTNFGVLFKEVNWTKNFDFSWEETYYLIKKIPVEKTYSLKWESMQEDKIREMLVEEHDFSRERVESSLGKLNKKTQSKQQKSLTDF